MKMSQLISAFFNFSVILQMYLLTVISCCSDEGSFPMLKRIRNQQRFSINFSTLFCIEKKLLEKTNAKDVINSFVLLKFTCMEGMN